MNEEKELHKDRECLHCVKFFDCKGKPQNVDKCLNYEESKKIVNQKGKNNEIHG